MGISCNSRSDENFISKKKNLKNLPFLKRDVFFKLAVVTIVSVDHFHYVYTLPKLLARVGWVGSKMRFPFSPVPALPNPVLKAFGSVWCCQPFKKMPNPSLVAGVVFGQPILRRNASG